MDEMWWLRKGEQVLNKYLRQKNGVIFFFQWCISSPHIRNPLFSPAQVAKALHLPRPQVSVITEETDNKKNVPATGCIYTPGQELGLVHFSISKIQNRIWHILVPDKDRCNEKQAYVCISKWNFGARDTDSSFEAKKKKKKGGEGEYIGSLGLYIKS